MLNKPKTSYKHNNHSHLLPQVLIGLQRVAFKALKIKDSAELITLWGNLNH
jgi:hypothetical protein